MSWHDLSSLDLLWKTFKGFSIHVVIFLDDIVVVTAGFHHLNHLGVMIRLLSENIIWNKSSSLNKNKSFDSSSVIKAVVSHVLVNGRIWKLGSCYVNVFF